MRAEITAYLESGYFAQGVQLLRRCAGAPLAQLRQFEQYLGRGYVPTAVELQLKTALRRELAVLPPAPEGEQPYSPPAPEGEHLPSPSPPATQNSKLKTQNFPFWSAFFARHSEPPAAILELRQRAILLHKEQARIHPLMAEAARAGKRKQAGELARERMDGQAALDMLYDAVREWEKSGKLPSAPQRNDAAAEVMEKMKRRKYCTERISRLKKWIAAGERVKTVSGERVRVRLSALEIRQYDDERLDRELELKGLNEELGL